MDIAAIVGPAGAGGFGILGLVIIYLLASNRSDRKQYEDQLDKAIVRADAAEERARLANEARDAESAKRRTAEERGDRLAREIDQRAIGGGGP